MKIDKIKCKKCGDIIELMDIYDFKWCSCCAITADGEHEYLRRVDAKRILRNYLIL